MRWNAATDVFTSLGPREYYRTLGMSELLLSLATQLSDRRAVAVLNHVRHATGDQATPVMTAVTTVEREGIALQEAQQSWGQEVPVSPRIARSPLRPQSLALPIARNILPNGHQAMPANQRS